MIRPELAIDRGRLLMLISAFAIYAPVTYDVTILIGP